MKKKKATPKKKKSGTIRNNGSKQGEEDPRSWVDKISWEPLSMDEETTTTQAMGSLSSSSFTIVSWNVLAEAYTNRRSHPHLPLSYQSVVFDRKKRRLLLQKTIRQLADISTDIFCLQEVDLPEQVTHYLQQQCDYQGYQTPTNKAGGGVAGRRDACAIYFSTRQFEWFDYDVFPPQVIHLDDIATLGMTTYMSSSSKRSDDSNNITSSSINNNNNQNKHYDSRTLSSNPSSLACSAFSTSFLKHNMAMMVALRHKATQQVVVVANTHLYWHPGFEYVKLCQMHYVMQKVTAYVDSVMTFLQTATASAAATAAAKVVDSDRNHHHHPSNSIMMPAVLICGDLNSLPNNSVHRYLTQGHVNAKQVAPWHFFWNPIPESHDDYNHKTDDDEDDDYSDVRDELPDESTTSHQPLNEDEEEVYDDHDEEEEEDGQIDSDELETAHSMDANENRDTPSTPDSMLHQDMSGLDLADRTRGLTDPVVSNVTSAIGVTSSYSTDSVRYLVDFTLNRLCRWLRIFGIDAAIETDAEEQMRTKEGKFKLLFDRCQSERRTLVTTSTKLVARNDCPPGTFLISPQLLPKLEVALAQLLLFHGVALEPSKFLSRCVVCNGNIRDVQETKEKRRILAGHQAPEELSLAMDVYECNGCGQGYWWCDRPSSSASRVKNQATRLFEVCIRAGVPIHGELNMFDFVNVKALREEGWDGPEPLWLDKLDVVEWLKDEDLSHSFHLLSAYKARSGLLQQTNSHVSRQSNQHGEELLPFTNVTHGFVGTLDYVFFDTRSLTQTHRLYVPTSFSELSDTTSLRNGHCLPSNVWPSDHLAIGARVALVNHQTLNNGNDQEVIIDKNVDHPIKTLPSQRLEPVDSINIIAPIAKPKSSPSSRSLSTNAYCQNLGVSNFSDRETSVSSTTFPNPNHNATATFCACGCVPKIRSLFEMAELRRQAKEKKAKA